MPQSCAMGLASAKTASEIAQSATLKGMRRSECVRDANRNEGRTK